MKDHVHHTEHQVKVSAPAGTVYDLIADVLAWPRVFPPTVHAEYVDRGREEERIRLWATANGELKTWVSRRVLDRAGLRVGFRQEVSQPPVAAMGGEWVVEPVDEGTCLVRLLHDFRAVDDDEENTRWITSAVDRNSGAELDALKAAAETGSDPESAFSFEDETKVAGAAADVYDFLNDAHEWSARLPHVARVSLDEPAPGVQVLEMDTRTPDGAVHTTRSTRLCFAPGRIVYKQHLVPALLRAHTGEWRIERVAGGAVVTSRHSVVLAPDAIAGVLGADASVADAARFVRSALSANSRATMELARRFAETRRAAAEHAGLYHQVQQFYADQMGLLDAGDAENWAKTFTEDGVFAQNVKPEPWRGRTEIGTRMRAGVDRVTARGLTRRHWFGMLSVTPQDDGSVRTRYYATVFETPKGGQAKVYLSTTGTDLLVRSAGGWLVAHRLVTHDGTD
jgi:ribosome-associated toxin RatA of RatAB toxin-antitoxin module/3-phenylpropionate/cinnamic acid dioxygenase small subunit